MLSPTVVELAPMAGITNAAYRQLCREQSEAGGGTGVFVCEMITSRGIVEGDRKTRQMLQFDPGETVRSVQLYGVDPAIMGRAADILCTEFGVGHIDLNFGCPVPKVTRKGGGAALPWKRDLLRLIVESVVAAGRRHDVPVTIKTRIGIDDDHHTYLDAGRIAEQAGCAAIALHGRTAQQAYAGHADWSAIAKLKEHVTIPVYGNGDTAGRSIRALPTLGEVTVILRRHAELLVALSDERHGLTDLRKHMAWYLKGFPVGGDIRRDLALVSSFAQLDEQLVRLDPDQPFPTHELGTPRGRQGSPRDKVALPEHWLDDSSGRDLDLAAAEIGVSGG